MINLHDVHSEGVVVDAIEQTVGTSTSTEQTGELSLEGLTHTVWPTGQVAEGKFNNRSQHPRCNGLQRTSRRAGELDLVVHATVSVLPSRHTEFGPDRSFTMSAS